MCVLAFFEGHAPRYAAFMCVNTCRSGVIGWQSATVGIFFNVPAFAWLRIESGSVGQLEQKSPRLKATFRAPKVLFWHLTFFR